GAAPGRTTAGRGGRRRRRDRGAGRMRRSGFTDPEDRALLASPGWSHCEGLIEAFEEAWRQGRSPAVADYARAEGPVRRGLLVELVHADLEFRLKAGNPVRVEGYLAEHPELAGNRRILRSEERRVGKECR